MTEKTLDEKVAEALGYELVQFSDTEFCYRKDSCPTKDQFYIDGREIEKFFTENISNCKKYIEPVLIESGGNKLGFSIGFRYGLWTICGIDAITCEFYFFGKGETEAEAYCDALLHLKAREQNNDKK